MDIVSLLFNDLKNAKTEPSKNCTDGKEHEFQFLMHSDGRETFSNVKNAMKLLFKSIGEQV